MKIYQFLFLTQALILPAMNGGVRLSNDKPILDSKLCYILEKPFNESIATFEAVINVPKNSNGGVIFGNFISNSYGYDGSCDFVVDSNGHFRVFHNRLYNSVAEVDKTFETVDLRTGIDTHIALSRDSKTNEFKYFVDGELVETFDAINHDVFNDMKYEIGTDWTTFGNNIDNLKAKMPFDGGISHISVFSDIRSNDEISNDYTNHSFNENTDCLIGSWNFNNWSKTIIEDYSKNNNNAVLGSYDKYFEIEEVEYFDYSFIVVPDIQIITANNQEKLENYFNWIVENKHSKKIQYVDFVGDLTDFRSNNDYQWKSIKHNFEKLDQAGIDYGFVIGNHDYDDGNGRDRSAEKMNEYLSYDKYSKKQYFGGSYKEGDILNTYNIKRICGVNYLFLNLEYGPRDEILKWAERVCQEHLDSRVIVTTHSYLEPNQTFTDHNDYYAPSVYGIGAGNSSNNGNEIFEKFVKKQENIFMVFSGHVSFDDIVMRKDVGIHGNNIYQFLMDAQGSFYNDSCDVLSLIKINENDKKAYFYWYSPYESKYLNLQNQFCLSLDSGEVTQLACIGK